MQMECKNPATIAADLANSVCVKKVKSSFFNLLILGILPGKCRCKHQEIRMNSH